MPRSRSRAASPPSATSPTAPPRSLRRALPGSAASTTGSCSACTPTRSTRRCASCAIRSAADAFGSRVRCGLSPHSPYTAGPGLLSAVHARARELGVPLAMHVAESAAEVELLARGTGPLAGTAERTAFGFAAPGTTTVAYLEALGVLDGAPLVHLGHIAADDIPRLVPASARRGRLPPVEPLPGQPGRAGARAPRRRRRGRAGHRLLGEQRRPRPDGGGARAPRAAARGDRRRAAARGDPRRRHRDRGRGDRGQLEPGKAADLAVFAIETRDDPIAATVARAGRETVRAVMSGGAWRVRDGALLRSDARRRRACRRRARPLARRARAALS